MPQTHYIYSKPSYIVNKNKNTKNTYRTASNVNNIRIELPMRDRDRGAKTSPMESNVDKLSIPSTMAA